MRRDYAGGAVATTLAGSINASSLTIVLTSSTGWPTGANGPFFVVINRGQSSEEKVLVTSRATNSLTVASISDRGVDGTSAASHNPGETVEHCHTATDADEANAHINNTGLDHHTQYLNNARHDVTARHAFGAALGTPAAAADVGTAASAGVGTVPARSDHVHKIGTAAINSAGMFAAGVVDAAAIGSDAVGSAEILAGAVGSSELADLNVTTAKLADSAVTSVKIADGTIVTADIANNAVTAAKIDSTAWAAPTLSNGWSNYENGWQVAQYRRVGDIVEIRGLVTGGAFSTSNQVFTLPVGFRPLLSHNQMVLCSAVSGVEIGRLDIGGDGKIYAVSGGTNAYFGLWTRFSITP